MNRRSLPPVCRRPFQTIHVGSAEQAAKNTCSTDTVLTRILALLSFVAIASGAAPPVAVFLDFEQQPSSETVARMKREVTEILKPTGLELDWRMLDERRPDESFADLVVVRFRGTCEMAPIPYYSELGPEPTASPLASTSTSGGHVLPFSEVQCDEIRRYIGPAAHFSQQQKRDAMLGRAVGRVLAHELYHVFAGTVQHGPDGVARSFHTRKELVADKFRFNERDSAKLRDLKWRALLAGEAKTPE